MDERYVVRWRQRTVHRSLDFVRSLLHANVIRENMLFAGRVFRRFAVSAVPLLPSACVRNDRTTVGAYSHSSKAERFFSFEANF